MDSEGQLSLFSVIPLSMPQEIVDRVLADGGNQKNSALRIVARFKKDFPVEQNAEFLQREYGTGGKGMVLNGRNVAVFWNAEGIRMAYGNTAQTERAMHISWMQAAKRIRGMLDAGLYMSNGQLDMVDYNERHELASQLWYFYRDNLKIPEGWRAGGFPEEVQKIMELLPDSTQLEQIAGRFFADAENVGKTEQPRYVRHSINRLKDNMTAILRPSLTFSASEPAKPPEKRFITQDEIDMELAGGNRVESGKARIYRYFQERHTPKERADFLKTEYGTGGHSHAMGGADSAWEDHSSKGIKLTRGGLMEAEAQVMLNWNQVARRIGELIASKRYLTPEEYEELRPEESASVIAVPAKAYELGFGSLGNGTTVWNRLEEENGDYKTVAHISDDGIVSLRDQNMPSEVVDRIHDFAEKQRIRAQTLPTTDTWVQDMAAQYGDQIVQRINSEADTMEGAALDEAISRITAEELQENPDVYQAYMENEGFRALLSEHIAGQIDIGPRGQRLQEAESEDIGPQGPTSPQTRGLEMDNAPEVLRALEQYQQYKQEYPQHLVFVQVNDHYEVYGDDTLRVQPILESNLFERTAPDGTKLPVTGFDRAESWSSRMHAVWKTGQNVLIAGLNEQGVYEILAERKGKDYVSVGAELTLDGHKFRVDSVNFENGEVQLQDLTMFESGYPLFRSEPIDWVHDQLETQPANEVILQKLQQNPELVQQLLQGLLNDAVHAQRSA